MSRSLLCNTLKGYDVKVGEGFTHLDLVAIV